MVVKHNYPKRECMTGISSIQIHEYTHPKASTGKDFEKKEK